MSGRAATPAGLPPDAPDVRVPTPSGGSGGAEYAGYAGRRMREVQEQVATMPRPWPEQRRTVQTHRAR
ncbi:MAG: hypothetical protein M3P51_12100, partial [Chloroflexota bacterium]|nr:hypothetical protein [Chloroflexota bacterium]